MIRHIRRSDIPRLREIGMDRDFDSDCIEGLVLVDENDRPVLFAGAWMLAEVHCAVDAAWSTPGARLLALHRLHEAMEARLKVKGIRQVVTWFDGAKDRFRRRLEDLGWIESQRTSWHRGVN